MIRPGNEPAPHGPAPGRGPVVADHCTKAFRFFHDLFLHNSSAALGAVATSLHILLTQLFFVSCLNFRPYLGTTCNMDVNVTLTGQLIGSTVFHLSFDLIHFKVHLLSTA